MRTLRLAHRGEEGEGVLGVHRCGSFHEVLDELTDEEALVRMPPGPGAIVGDVGVQRVEVLGIGDHDCLFPPVALEMRGAALAQEHDRSSTATCRAEREIPAVVVAVPVGRSEVLHDDGRLRRGEHDVGDVRGLLIEHPLVPGSDDLLGDCVSRDGECGSFGERSVDEIEEDALGCVSELMGSLFVEQPGEDVGELLLVGAVVHHPEHVELLGEAPRE